MIKTVKMVKIIKIFKNGKNDKNGVLKIPYGIFGIQGVPAGYEPQTMIANESRSFFEKMYFAPKNCFFSLF